MYLNSGKNTVIVIILMQLSLRVMGQIIPDTSGYWNGVVQVSLVDDLAVEYYFSQNGALLQGYAVGRSLNQKDSSKILFSGAARSKSINLKLAKYIYKVGPGCLSNVKLTYSKVGSQEKLIGKWYGDISFRTCPPEMRGKVELLKVGPYPEEKSRATVA